MNNCFSEWDVAGRDIDVAMHSIESFPTNKRRWDPISQRKYSFPDKSYSPNNELEELQWENGQLFIVTSSLDSKAHKYMDWLSSTSKDMLAVSESDWHAACARSQSLQKAGSFESVASGLPVSSSCDGYMQEDEMISWLHCPLDEPLETYCSELVVHSLNASKGHARCDTEEAGLNVNRNNSKSYGFFPRAVNMNRSSVKGLRSLATTEAANNVCTLKGDAATSKEDDNQLAANSANDAAMFYGTSNINKLALGSSMVQSVLPKVAARTSNSHSIPTTKASINFSLFSRPAAAIKERIQMVMGAGPTETQRLEQLDRVVAESCMSNESPGKPVIMELNAQSAEANDSMLLNSVKGVEEFDMTFMQQTLQGSCCTKDADPKLRAYNVTSQSLNHEVSCSNPCAISSDALGTEKGVEIIEACGPTLTASSGGSGNSATKNKKQGKRKVQDTVDSECQSKDSKERPDHDKKSAHSHLVSTKRSRAAEIHNQSERRRRDRINDKLKALQELIPNSNKTDKASLLEEAIEYLKMLQMQLQVMSFQSGISVSPKLIPPEIQHLQMTQMAILSHMHMGLGMGMGMFNMSAVAPGHLMPLPLFPGFSIPGSVSVPSSAMTSLQGHIASTIPVPVVPATGISSFPLPASAVPGLSTLRSPEYTAVPTVMRPAVNSNVLRNVVDVAANQSQICPQAKLQD